MTNETDNLRGTLEERIAHLEKRLHSMEKINAFNETVLINAVRELDPEILEKSQHLARVLTGIDKQ